MALVAGMGLAANAAVDSHVLAIHCAGQHYHGEGGGPPHDGCGD